MARQVLIASIKHETNTFSNRPADLAAFHARYCYRGEEIPTNMRGTKVEMAAFFDAADRHGWSLTYPIATSATPSGRVAKAAFDEFAGDIMTAIDQGPRFDAILLALHGAMVLEHHEDGEGLLLEMVRDKVGRDVPIGVTLDLHANATDRMAELADVMVSYRTYPHIDQYEIATQAADLIARTLAGEIRPNTVVARRPMLDGADHGRTTAPGPMTELLARADQFITEPGVLAVSINGGFPWTDIRDVGPTAVVTGDGNSPRYREIAELLMDDVWDKRAVSTITTVSADPAIADVRQHLDGGKPVVLADFADNPGGGGYGDATGLLGRMIAAGFENAAFATMCDPAAVRILVETGVGGTASLELGGKIDPRYGTPLNVTGQVKTITDGTFRLDGPMIKGAIMRMGPTAVLRVGGIDIVVTGTRHQVVDLQYFKHAGIDPTAKSVLGIKSAHHFRAAYGPIAAEVIVVDDGGGLTSRNYRSLPYRNVRRPVYPLDLD